MAKLVDALKPSLYSFISISACFLVISAAKDFIPRNLAAFLLFFLLHSHVYGSRGCVHSHKIICL